MRSLKNITNRLVSLLLVVVMVLIMLPAMSIEVSAATSGTLTGLTDATIGLSFSGNANDAWTVSGTQIIGTATASTGCGAQDYNSTLTITNTKNITATLSFDYVLTANGGSFQVDGAAVTSNDSFTKEVPAGESIKVYFKTSGNTTTITLNNVSLVGDVSAEVTFAPAENGSYTVDGNVITEAYSNTQSSTIAYNVVATPAVGYKFFGWYNETTGTIINRNASAALNIEQNCTITAKFVESELAEFETAGMTFADLGEAVVYAKDKKATKITQVVDGVIRGNYTIPKGITLLIPFDDAGTVYTTSPKDAGTTASTRKAFRTLTMKAGSSITIEGTLSVSAKHNAMGGGSERMSVSGPYGFIKMEDGSNITVNSAANLYAWGFISGNGNVIAKSGSTVYEYFQICDFRGGSQTSALGDTDVFPFSQYYVQNVEAPLTFEAGASEKVFASLYASRMTVGTSIDFIGQKGLFQLTSGSLTKVYDPSSDRMNYTLNGELNLNHLQVTLAIATVNSKDFVLPINSNLSLIVQTGKTNINQDIYLAPGASIDIAEGADFTIAEGYSVYVYDKSEWGNYCYEKGNAQFIPVAYSPTKSYNRSNNDLIDAKINVNGSLNVDGFLYTTDGGADISSNSNGKVFLNGGVGNKTVTHQCENNGPVKDIVITPAKLHNAAQYVNTEDEYTLTSDAVAGDVFTYSSETGKWSKPTACTHENTIVKDAKEATCTEAGYTGDTYCVDCDEKLAEGEAIEALGHAYIETVVKEATCTEAGEKQLACTRCDDVKTEVIPAAGHTWDDGIVNTEPTCNEDGTITYTCTVCDETKTEAVSATGHTPVVDEAVAATCTETGLTEGTHCSVCSTVIVAQEVVLAKGHTEVVDEGKEATCTEEGLTEGKHCSVCDTVIVAQEVIPAKGHTEVVDEGKEATCTEEGLTEGKHCSVCEEVLVKPEVIPALGHTEVVDAGYAATCTEAGKTEGKHCSVCGEILVEQQNIPALGHDYVDHVCSHCGDVQLHGWVNNERGTTYYIDGVQAYFDTWATIDEADYFFDPEGYIVKGLCTITDENDNTATYVFDNETGVFCKDLNGIYIFDEVAYIVTNGIAVEVADGWNTINGAVYFFDTKSAEFVSDGIFWLPYPTGYGPDQWNMENNDDYATMGYDTQSYFIFDENGVFQNSINGMYAVKADTKVVGGAAEVPTADFTAWAVNGELPYHPGLVESNGDYYYFKTASFEAGKSFVTSADYTVSKTNDLDLPEELGEGTFTVGKYTFDESGKLLLLDGLVDVDADTYYYVKGIKTYAGLIQIGDDYYYINSSCKAVKGRDYTVSKTNGLLPAGTYTFDAEGKLVHDEEPLNGIVKETEAKWYYYVNGVKAYAGLIQIDGDYYYVNSNFEVIHGRNYFISKTNGLMPNATYEFDADGKMVVAEEVLNGIVKESDSVWYYYVDGVKTYAGLIQIDGAYYYVNSSFQVIHGRNYFVSKTNGLMPNGTYEFDADGKMVVADEILNGIVKESDDVWYYYVNGVKTYAGLIQIDGAYYYVNSSFKVIHNQSYFVSKTNGIVPNGTYTFDADGIMTLN